MSSLSPSIHYSPNLPSGQYFGAGRSSPSAGYPHPHQHLVSLKVRLCNHGIFDLNKTEWQLTISFGFNCFDLGAPAFATENISTAFISQP